MLRPPPSSTLFPYTTLFRSARDSVRHGVPAAYSATHRLVLAHDGRRLCSSASDGDGLRSEEHTSELQSRRDLVCRLLLEKKKDEHTAAAHAREVRRAASLEG